MAKPLVLLRSYDPRFGDWLLANIARRPWAGEAAQRRAACEITPVPVGRAGRVEDIAQIVCMLASPAAGYMTGRTFVSTKGRCRA